MEEKGVDLRRTNFHVKLRLELCLMAGECVIMYNFASTPPPTPSRRVPAPAGVLSKLAWAGAWSFDAAICVSGV
jgi:hypothetical protein